MGIEFAAICTWTWYRATASLTFTVGRGHLRQLALLELLIWKPTGSKEEPNLECMVRRGLIGRLRINSRFREGVFCRFSDNKGGKSREGPCPPSDVTITTMGRGGSFQIISFCVFFYFLETCEGDWCSIMEISAM